MELPYLKQECPLTLKEGLEIHYSVNSTFKENVIAVPAFYNHDIAHVLFGLSTEIEHESLVDTRVIFGTNWGFKKYINDYLRNPEEYSWQLIYRFSFLFWFLRMNFFLALYR